MKNTRTFKDKILLIVKGLTLDAENKILRVLGGIVTFAAGFMKNLFIRYSGLIALQLY
ncbi:hypothetical protein [Kordia sp.]|uniref:hypothetical protein n=1 Tax=Kordia sp. TaxID=1965332 RepID=UPI003D6AEE60